MHETMEFVIRHGYSVFFLWVFVGQLGLPIPATPVLLAAGALVGFGQLNFGWIIGLTVAAALISDLLWYQLGRKQGSKVLSLLCRISFDPDSCVRTAKSIFARHGSPSLLVAKFIPGVSTVAPPLAGILRMHLFRFLLFDGMGALFWAGVFIGLGYQFSEVIEYYGFQTLRLGFWVGGAALAALAMYIVWKFVQRRRSLGKLAMARITPEEVKQKLDAGEDLLIVDVRDALEFSAEPRTLPGAIHLPLEQLDKRQHMIPRDREIVLCCS